MAFILVQSHRTLLIYMLSSEGVWDEFCQGERKYGQEEDYKELCYDLLWSRNQVKCHCKCFTYALYMHSFCVAWTKIDPRERINGMENFYHINLPNHIYDSLYPKTLVCQWDMIQIWEKEWNKWFWQGFYTWVHHDLEFWL